MDYEKAYKEALEKARAYMNKGYYVLMPEIFPELKESEDEQHRKWILEYLYDGLRKSDEQFKDQFKSAIAWLEKQCKEKPKWTLRDDDLFQDALGAFEAPEDWGKLYDWLKSLKQRLGGK